jgi:hypothetical protein
MPIYLTPADAARLGLTPPRKRGQKVKTGRVSPEVFKALCREQGLQEPLGEVYFHPERQWRLDWVFPTTKGAGFIALEIDGGSWLKGGGRHTRGKGFQADCEKQAEAVIAGYRVIRCTTADVESGRVFDWIRRALNG